MECFMNDNCALVVTYNRPKLLVRCIDGLMNQTSMPNSIIIIDNGSGKETYELLLANGYVNPDCIQFNSEGVYHQKLKRNQVNIYYFKLVENKGPGYAFYFGVKSFLKMNYKWLWMMDDDGVPEHECLRHLENHKKNADFLNPVVLDEDDPEQLAFGLYSKKYKQPIKSKSDAIRYAENGLIHDSANPFNGTFLSRKLIISIGLPLYQMYGWGVEVEYKKRAAKFGFKVATVTEAYHFHPASRVEQVSILNGRYKLNQQSNKFKNYIDVRNNNYIWYRYNGLEKNLKFFLAYSFFFLTQLKPLEWFHYLRASFDGIFAIWGKEKRFLK